MVKKKDKDPHAVALGRKGGKARIEKMTPERRSEIARKAVLARWAKYKKDQQKPE
jgi:general stress protein YciG